jgi:hypothetical protein
MATAWKSARALVALVLPSIVGSACQQQYGDTGTMAPSRSQLASKAVGQPNAAGSVNGAGGQMPAYYDGKLFTVNMKELAGDASAALIAKNSSINKIYATNDLDDPQDFFPVIDAIQGDGFNPLWRQILIVFNPGFTPHQFLSDDEVLAAAAGPNPAITLVETDEMYRCSVVGPK